MIIHGGYGVKKTKDTTYINCSLLDKKYQMVNDLIVVDI